MGVSYNRLWKLLIDKNMKRIEMQNLTGISGNILARMGKRFIQPMSLWKSMNLPRIRKAIPLRNGKKKPEPVRMDL